MVLLTATVTAALAVVGVSARGLVARAPGNTTNSATSLTLLYQNNLNLTDDANHIGAILLDAQSPSTASAACGNIGETLLTQAALTAHSSDFVSLLNYEVFAGRFSADQSYLIQGGTVELAGGKKNARALTYGATPYGNRGLPVLCTQSSNQNQPTNAVATASNKITLASRGNTFTGFRNQKAFRFLGIPYANKPKRFEYTTQNTATGQAYDATAYGGVCAQPYNAATVEDCLYLNIQTPYIPKANSKKDLRPVLFWIHGGGFTGGQGSNPGTDGGQIASHEDNVVVTINYRLTTLGFLAIPGTDIKGNFGIADQIVALDWVIANIAAFGGDPKKITIAGSSAGAGSCRTLLGSPKAIGKFQGAIVQSNLGGGQALGLTGDYATTYSQYLTVNQSYAQAGQQIFQAVGCNQTALADQIACLKTVPAQTIVNLPTVARYVVQDGTIVDTPNLDVARKLGKGDVAKINTIWGTVRNDGASFSTYPTTPVTSEVQGLMVGLGISQFYAQQVIDSGLFPYYDTGNITADSFNVTQRVAEDLEFRCIDQATVYTGVKTGALKDSYFYQLDRSSNGYNPNNVDAKGPIEPGYPNGDPNLPYYRLHGSDGPSLFGNLQPLRDANDLLAVQLSTSYFGSFVRDLQPNPSTKYLTARGYTTVLQQAALSGPWEPVKNDQGPIKLLDFVSNTVPFVDLPQCAFLNYSINYYLNGGA